MLKVFGPGYKLIFPGIMNPSSAGVAGYWGMLGGGGRGGIRRVILGGGLWGKLIGNAV